VIVWYFPGRVVTLPYECNKDVKSHVTFWILSMILHLFCLSYVCNLILAHIWDAFYFSSEIRCDMTTPPVPCSHFMCQSPHSRPVPAPARQTRIAIPCRPSCGRPAQSRHAPTPVQEHAPPLRSHPHALGIALARVYAAAAQRPTRSGQVLAGERAVEEIRIRGTFVFSQVFSYFPIF
jgi:hypothetical protein